jgi:predicted nucleic acid-binding Zn ribbon protein
VKEKTGSLKSVLKGIIKDLGKKRLTEEEIKKAWGSAVGKKAASHTKPVSLKKARLVVNVDRSAWLYELTLKKREILEKLQAKLEAKKIKEIRFRIGEVE